MLARAALLILAVLLLATGCGGSSKKKAAAPAPTTTAAAKTTPTTTEKRPARPATTTTSGAATVHESAADKAFASAGRCTLLRSLGAKVSQAVPPTFKVSRTDVAAQTAALRALAADAPPEIRADFQLYVDVFSRYMATWESIGLRSGKALTHAQYVQVTKAATAAINAPGIAAAEQNIKHWVRAHCPKAPKR